MEVERDQKFGSLSLQRRVRCELDRRSGQIEAKITFEERRRQAVEAVRAAFA